MPKISVIIPTFNRLNLLKKALKSVENQSFKDIEIIISDDHSNDGTSEFCKSLKNVKYVLNEKYKKGPNGNKNNGLDYASGEFVCFLDDDDELMPDALETLFEKANQGYSHIFSNCLIKKNDILSDEFSGKGLNESCDVSKKDFLMGKFSGEFFSIFKLSLLENQRFNDEFYGNEATLWVSLYKEKSFYIHKPLRIYHILRDDSVTLAANKNAARVFKGYLKMAQIIEAEMLETRDFDLASKCASEYKMAAYYAKFANEKKVMFQCLFKSLRIKPNLPALILLILSFLPNNFIAFLSKIRSKI